MSAESFENILCFSFLGPKWPAGASPPAEHQNGNLPTVVISQPGSPDTIDKQSEERNGRAFYIDDDNDCSSFDGSQLGVMNHELDYSTLSINMPGGATEQLWPVAPDGGYGWIIVLAAFFSNLIVDGVCTSFAEFKKSYSEHFHSSDAATALIGSILIGVYLLVGPIVGGLVNKYGARAVVVAGAVVSGIAFIISVASPNIYIFMVIYGGLGGAGFGMIYLPAIVVVSYYFESKRAMATGIAVAGSGVGTIVMPILSEYCIANFGWKYTVWVLASLVFSCSLFGLLYRPLPMPNAAEIKDQELQPLRQALSKMSDDDPQSDPTLQRLRNALSECEGEAPESPATQQKPPLSPLPENTASKSRASTNVHAPISASSSRPRKLTLTSMTSDMASTNDLKASRTNLNSQLSRISVRSYAKSLSKLSRAGDASTLSIAMSGVDPKEFSRPMNRQDIFYGGSIRNLKEFKQEGGHLPSYRASVLSIPRSVVGQAASQMNLAQSQAGDLGSRMGGSRMSRNAGGLAEEEEIIDDFYDNGRCRWIPLAIRNAFSEMIDFELLKDPVMLLLCISNLLGMMGFYIPFVFLKDLANENKVDPASSRYLVPIIGVTNTVGRVFFGWFTDQGYISALNINNLALLICGVLTLACPFMPSFVGLTVYSSLFGFFISAYICLTSVVLSDLLGLEKLTNSFGLVVVARGISSLLGSPFAGLVYDMTQSYSAAFYFGGVVIFVAGLISCGIPFIYKWKKDVDDNEGDEFTKFPDQDNMSGKLSVLTERSEENLTEYQRTIQSLRQQYALLQEMEDEKKKQKKILNGTAVEEVNEEEEEAVPMKSLKRNKEDDKENVE
ncbi:unnamed protein product [Caenorhabditis auriculariae]|uniref:Major facilitator superfamily (MFS) profile domain-containing protein n=1 Tax=Caenorhabditis auriculariae TaxID=2777116 RepID=A0A8S1GND1_9PELO|nr:unnamed protein product [Caenorhabditis auriculariae]